MNPDNVRRERWFSAWWGRLSTTGRRRLSSRDVGLCGLLFFCEQGIEIDQLRIVSLGFAESCAAVKMHQGLHTAGV